MNPESPCHLCVTHSPLVTRVFEAAMRQRDIPADAVRSIARRGVSFPGIGVCLDDLSDEMERCFKAFDRRGYRAVRKSFDEALSGLTCGRPFEAYIPHANKILYQEIICHHSCTGYSFLEEGFTSMAWNVWRNSRTSWPKMLRNHLRTWWIRPDYRFTRPMFDHSSPTYRAAYAISGHAFHGMPGRIDVSGHIPPLPEGSGPGKTYVILDASYLHQGIAWDAYENALVTALLKQALPAGEVLVKFHFADAMATQRFESLRRRLKEHGAQDPRILGGEFSVEENLTRADLLLFALSSLGYYTALAGGTVKCFAPSIQGLDVKQWIARQALPPVFEQVTGINP